MFVFRFTYFLKFTDFLCNLSDNIYGINFTKLKIRNMENNLTLLEVTKDDISMDKLLKDENNEYRTIKYKFPASFLSIKTIGTLSVCKLLSQ